ncbi:hypothetical protein [Yoonia sp. 2307UL14-13]|uniref:hypothetical protein n=1 Tax=Yoonia sp. 2307UL14-13 TaxID=3126506 RepID=UPI0030A9B867
MSAPDTNVEKQTRRHRPSLLGISVAVGFALILLCGLIIFVVERGQEPAGADDQIDGRTGAVVESTD